MGAEPSPLLGKILKEPKPLSKSQEKAVLSHKKYIRVIAGAGAGKTETLTRKIVTLLLVENVPPSSIVAFTFTEKAAQSMKSRVYERVKLLGGEEHCAHLGEMFIGTIHAYCLRVLQDHFGFGGFGSLDENQEMAFLLRFGWDLHLTGGRNYSENCELFKQTLNVIYSEMIPDSVLEKRAKDFFRSYKKYEEHLTHHKRLTFNRMIALAVTQLKDKPDVLSGVKYLIVDEYQDINRAQEQLINLIGKSGNTFIVGDPRQTIYQFRGSDAGCFDEFVTAHKDAETISITENRRSSTSVVTVANEFSDCFTLEHYDHLVATRTDEGGVYLGEFETDNSEAEWIADQIDHYVKSGRCSYADIGILLRSVNTSGPAFIDMFRQRHIPFIVGGKVGLFRRSDVQAVGKLIAWLSPEGFFQKSKWSGKDTIRGDDLLPVALNDWNDAVPEIVLPKEVNAALDQWKASTLRGTFKHFTEMYHELLTILGFQRLDPENPEHSVVMANLGRFGSMLTDFETANRLGGRHLHWEADLKSLCWFMNTYASSSYEEQMGDDLRGVDAVQLMTVHQAKGLEWSLVFIPSVVNGRFPSRMVGAEKIWLIPRDLFNVRRYEGDLEVERKLMYVALTRAKDVLVVSYFTRLNGRRKGTSELVDECLPVDRMTQVSDRDRLPLHDLSPHGNTEDIQSYSAGEIIVYGKCPHMYRLGQVWGYQPGLSEFLGYGTSLHFCMRIAAEQMKQGVSPITAVTNAVDRHFFLPFADEGRHMKFRDAAKKKLIKFARDHKDDMQRIREVETRVEYPMHQATVVGKIDVILHDGEGVEIRDYKTSDRVTTQDEASMQVRIYARGLTMLGDTVTRGSIAYLEDGSLAEVTMSEHDLKSAELKAGEHIDGIKRRKFQPCPSDSCGQCNFGNICRWRK
jgi:DNA helicase II / ATP-dependent DNA helicase PcrA